jgi:hypothetical protein
MFSICYEVCGHFFYTLVPMDFAPNAWPLLPFLSIMLRLWFRSIEKTWVSLWLLADGQAIMQMPSLASRRHGRGALNL